MDDGSGMLNKMSNCCVFCSFLSLFFFLPRLSQLCKSDQRQIYTTYSIISEPNKSIINLLEIQTIHSYTTYEPSLFTLSIYNALVHKHTHACIQWVAVPFFFRLYSIRQLVLSIRISMYAAYIHTLGCNVTFKFSNRTFSWKKKWISKTTRNR